MEWGDVISLGAFVQMIGVIVYLAKRDAKLTQLSESLRAHLEECSEKSQKIFNLAEQNIRDAAYTKGRQDAMMELMKST